MGKVHTAAHQQIYNEAAHIPILGDASWNAQVSRWGSKPLKTLDPRLVKPGSFTGRAYCIKELIHTLFREVYRELKNFIIVAEKTMNFVRIFFQTLFKEDGFTWTLLRKRGKDLLNATAAFIARPLTYVLDISKLAVGILVPSAAIHGPKILDPDSNPLPQDDLSRNQI